MRETITISLPRVLKKELDRVTIKEGLSRSDIVRASLSDFLFLRQFRSLRAKMLERAQLCGVYTDEDVFKKVS